MPAYYNEVDEHAAGWLRNLVAAGLLPAGDVDERDIRSVQPDDLRGYEQAHFFAGIGGWSYAARLAGWPDDRPLWTGSCPCQPFSVAGQGRGEDDPRHLWPDFFRLVRACRPPVVMGEQVAGAAGYRWLDGVRADLAGESYASRGVDIPSCAVDAPHIRSRLYWIAADESYLANAEGQRWKQRAGAGWGDGTQAIHADGASAVGNSDREGERQPQGALGEQRRRIGDADAFGAMEHALGLGWGEGWPQSGVRRGRPALAGADALGVALGDADGSGLEVGRGKPGDACEERAPAQRADGRNGTFWSDAVWIKCHDGKARRAQPGAPLLVDGVSGRVAVARAGIRPAAEVQEAEDVRWIARVGAWRGLGNAINPELAKEVIAAWMECLP